MQERGTVTALSGRRRRSLLIAGIVAALVVAADQVTTSMALAHLRGPVHLIGPLGLDLQFNSGTAFSLLSGAGLWITPVVLVACAVLVWLAWHGGRTVYGVGYGLLLGGALGNLADRVFRAQHGRVVDFVTLSHWPTFNLADAGITAGALVLVAALLFGGRNEAGGARTDERAPGPHAHADGLE